MSDAIQVKYEDPHDMDDPSAVEPFDEGAPQHPTNQGSSIIDLLKRDAAELQVTDVYIPINGWENTGLAVRYELPERGKDLDAIVVKIERQFKKDQKYERNLYIGIDTMIKLCRGLYVKSDEAISEDNPNGWVELDPLMHGTPLTFADGEELSGILGWAKPESARDTVKMLFGGNDRSINDHAARLNMWLADTKTDVSKALWAQGE